MSDHAKVQIFCFSCGAMIDNGDCEKVHGYHFHISSKCAREYFVPEVKDLDTLHIEPVVT